MKNKKPNWINFRKDNNTLKTRIDELEKRIKEIEQWKTNFVLRGRN